MLGERVPIKSDKVRIAILASQQKVLEIQAAGKEMEGVRFAEAHVPLDKVMYVVKMGVPERRARR